MQQYFFETTIELNQILYFTAEQLHHIKHVMRMKQGDVVKVVDKNGLAFLATIEMDKEVSATTHQMLESNVEEIKITLVQGMIKGDRWDLVLQKACELGVHSIIPMISSRSVVKMNDKIDKKLERYNKIAKEACEQSKRNHLVQVKKPITLKEMKEHMSSLNLIAYEHADVTTNRLKNILEENRDVKDITIVVGCEGGFSQKEVEELIQQGFECVSLGKRILRAETAAMALIQSIMFYYE